MLTLICHPDLTAQPHLGQALTSSRQFARAVLRLQRHERHLKPEDLAHCSQRELRETPLSDELLHAMLLRAPHVRGRWPDNWLLELRSHSYQLELKGNTLTLKTALLGKETLKLQFHLRPQDITRYQHLCRSERGLPTIRLRPSTARHACEESWELLIPDAHLDPEPQISEAQTLRTEYRLDAEERLIELLRQHDHDAREHGGMSLPDRLERLRGVHFGHYDKHFLTYVVNHEQDNERTHYAVHQAVLAHVRAQRQAQRNREESAGLMRQDTPQKPERIIFEHV